MPFGGELLAAKEEEDEGMIAQPVEVAAIELAAADLRWRCRFGLGFGSSKEEEEALTFAD